LDVLLSKGVLDVVGTEKDEIKAGGSAGRATISKTKSWLIYRLLRMAEAAFNGSTKVYKNLKVRENSRTRAKLGGHTLLYAYSVGSHALRLQQIDVAQDDIGRLGSFIRLLPFKSLGLGTMICRSCISWAETGFFSLARSAASASPPASPICTNESSGRL
jgi:hypothetical protein